MSTTSPLPAVGRRALVIVLGLLALATIVIAFSGALTRSTDLEAQAEQARAETARVEAEVNEGERELEYVTTDAFFEWEARAVGYGEQGEQPFELPADAPPPQPIVPIGPQSDTTVAKAPFDAWMELLFGA